MLRPEYRQSSTGSVVGYCDTRHDGTVLEHTETKPTMMKFEAREGGTTRTEGAEDKEGIDQLKCEQGKHKPKAELGSRWPVLSSLVLCSTGRIRLTPSPHSLAKSSTARSMDRSSTLTRSTLRRRFRAHHVRDGTPRTRAAFFWDRFVATCRWTREAQSESTRLTSSSSFEYLARQFEVSRHSACAIETHTWESSKRIDAQTGETKTEIGGWAPCVTLGQL